MDLHIHTTASDGTFTPSEAVYSAKENNVRILSIADHDTINGAKQALPVAYKNGVCLIPAVELSADFENEIHILGYGIDPFHKTLERNLEELRSHRTLRTKGNHYKIKPPGRSFARGRPSASF